MVTNRPSSGNSHPLRAREGRVAGFGPVGGPVHGRVPCPPAVCVGKDPARDWRSRSIGQADPVVPERVRTRGTSAGKSRQIFLDLPFPGSNVETHGTWCDATLDWAGGAPGANRAAGANSATGSLGRRVETDVFVSCVQSPAGKDRTWHFTTRLTDAGAGAFYPGLSGPARSRSRGVRRDLSRTDRGRDCQSACWQRRRCQVSRLALASMPRGTKVRSVQQLRSSFALGRGAGRYHCPQGLAENHWINP